LPDYLYHGTKLMRKTKYKQKNESDFDINLYNGFSIIVKYINNNYHIRLINPDFNDDIVYYDKNKLDIKEFKLNNKIDECEVEKFIKYKYNERTYKTIQKYEIYHRLKSNLIIIKPLYNNIIYIYKLNDIIETIGNNHKKYNIIYSCEKEISKLEIKSVDLFNKKILDKNHFLTIQSDIASYNDKIISIIDMLLIFT
jgi:hypothetical protein